MSMTLKNKKIYSNNETKLLRGLLDDIFRNPYNIKENVYNEIMETIELYGNEERNGSIERDKQIIYDRKNIPDPNIYSQTFGDNDNVRDDVFYKEIMEIIELYGNEERNGSIERDKKIIYDRKNIPDPNIYSQTFGDNDNVRDDALMVLKQVCDLVIDKKQLSTDITRMFMLHCMVDSHILQRPINFKQEFVTVSVVNALVALYTQNTKFNNPILNYIMKYLEFFDKNERDTYLKRIDTLTHESVIHKRYNIYEFMDKIIDQEQADISRKYYVELALIMKELWEKPEIIDVSDPQFLFYYTDFVYGSILSFYYRYEKEIKKGNTRLPRLFEDTFTNRTLRGFPVLFTCVLYMATLYYDVYAMRNLLLSGSFMAIGPAHLTSLLFKAFVDVVLISTVNGRMGILPIMIMTRRHYSDNGSICGGIGMLPTMIRQYSNIFEIVYDIDDKYIVLGKKIIDLSMYLIFKTMHRENNPELLRQYLDLITKICFGARTTICSIPYARDDIIKYMVDKCDYMQQYMLEYGILQDNAYKEIVTTIHGYIKRVSSNELYEDILGNSTFIQRVIEEDQGIGKVNQNGVQVNRYETQLGFGVISSR